MATEYKPSLEEFKTDEEINAAIQAFMYETGELVYYLKMSRERDGWEKRLEKKRKEVLQFYKKAQDFIYICMKDKRESVPYRIIDIINLLWLLRNIGVDYVEYSNMSCRLIVDYKKAPILENLINL